MAETCLPVLYTTRVCVRTSYIYYNLDHLYLCLPKLILALAIMRRTKYIKEVWPIPQRIVVILYLED